MRKKKVALIAYSCSPVRGSEYSVAWNYITKMHEIVELDVYLGAAGEHLGDFEELKYASEDIHQRVNFVKVKPNMFSRAINYFNKRKIFTYAFYIAYKFWHKSVFNIIKGKVSEYDVVHFLCPHGYRVPGDYHKLDIKTVWGPIGGFGNVDRQFVLYGRNKVAFRTILNNVQLLIDRSYKIALRNYDVVFSSNLYNQQRIKDISGRSTIVIPENGLTSNLVEKKSINIEEMKVVNILWVGTLNDRKSLDLLILACSKLDISYVINVVGHGPLHKKLEELSKCKMVNIKFHGQLSRDRVLEMYESNHVHVITSLLEGNPTVLWEAMSAGLPTISLRNSGMATTLCEKCGVLIDMRTRQQIISDLASALSEISNINNYSKLVNGLCDCRTKFQWEKRIPYFLEAYEK